MSRQKLPLIIPRIEKTAILLLGLLLWPGVVTPGWSADKWISVKSKNFFLVGNSSEKSIREIGLRLEQFRDVFSKLFSKVRINSSVPTTVVVFKDQRSFEPYKPLFEGKPMKVGGLFIQGSDRNYIVMTAQGGGESSESTIYHEFTHSLVRDNTVSVPAWFNEGLAEYYSTFDITDGDRKVWLGKPVLRHIQTLRERPLMPLPQLFSIGYGSREFNEQLKDGIFYAQSWALMHYFLLGKKGERQPQLQKFMGLLEAEGTVEESFQAAFGTDFSAIERELSDYLRGLTLPAQAISFNKRLELDSPMTGAPISEAESLVYLGDLQTRMVDHVDKSERNLLKALQLDPKLAAAHSALGFLRLRERKFEVAREHLSEAIGAGSANYLTHYYWALTYFQESDHGKRKLADLSDDEVAGIRKALQQSISLDPAFLDAYRYLGYLNVVFQEELPETEQLLRRALSLAPGREDVAMMLAHTLLRLHKYVDAKQVLTPIARVGVRKDEAQTLLNSIETFEAEEPEPESRLPSRALNSLSALADRERERRAGAAEKETVEREDEPPVVLRRPGVSPNTPEVPANEPRLRREGERMAGLLTVLDCSKGLTISLRTGSGTVQFHTDTPSKLEFTSFTARIVDTIACGRHEPGIPVAIYYRRARPGTSNLAGEPLVVEFVEKD